MAVHRGRKAYVPQYMSEDNELSDVDTIDIMIPGSPQSDGGKSDDTEYLLGANVSVRDISMRDISYRDFGHLNEQEDIPVKKGGSSYVKRETQFNSAKSKIPKQLKEEGRHGSREVSKESRKYDVDINGDRNPLKTSPKYKSKRLAEGSDGYKEKIISTRSDDHERQEVKGSVKKTKRKSSERKKREDLRSMGVEFSDDDDFDVDREQFIDEQDYDISPVSENYEVDMISDILSDIDFGVEVEHVKKNLFGRIEGEDNEEFSKRDRDKYDFDEDGHDSEDEEMLVSISQRDMDIKGGGFQRNKYTDNRRDFDHEDTENYELETYRKQEHRSPSGHRKRSPDKRQSPNRITVQQSKGYHGSDYYDRQSPLRTVDQNSPQSSLEGLSPERSHERHRSKHSPDRRSPHRSLEKKPKQKLERSPDKRTNGYEREHGDSFSPGRQKRKQQKKHQDVDRSDSKGSSTFGSQHQASMELQNEENASIEEELKKKNLALNVDPQTNEVYDDKVKEGADLVAKLLGTDFQKVYSPQSNTSKDSNTSDAKEKTKQQADADISKEELKKENISQEGDSEQVQKAVKFQDSRQDSSDKRDMEEYVPTPLRNSVLEIAASEPQQKGFKTSTPHYKKIISPEPKAKVNPEFHTDFYMERQAELQQKVFEMDRRLREDVTKLRDIELDIDEANSKKKLILHDVKVLEETLNRNRSESKSCESLLEEYRKQATKARAELLDLEKQRDRLHHEVMASKERKQGEASERVIEVDHLGMGKKELFALMRERDELRGELDALRSQMLEDKLKVDSEKDFSTSQIKSLEEQVAQLYKQLDESREKYHKMREQLDGERQRAREAHVERLNAINKLQEDTKEMQGKEVESLKSMLRERNSELEMLQDKMWKEHERLSQTIEEQQFRITKQDNDLRKNEEEIKGLMVELKQQKQHYHESEKQWREAIESEKEKYKEQASFSDEKESMLVTRQRDLEQVLEQKSLQNKIFEEKTSAQIDELQSIIKDKDEEVLMMKGLIRQQEDATRNLGDRLRNESQEQLRNALAKERESMEHEIQKHKSRFNDIQEKFDKQVHQMKEDLDKERKSHKQAQSTVTRLKQEMDQLREENVNANEERIRAVNKARNENREEFTKIKEKLQQVSIQTDKLEKDAVKEIYEECNKIASMIGSSPLKFSPARNGNGIKTGSPVVSNGSLIKNALARLLTMNEELRQYHEDLKKENKKQKQEINRIEMMTNAEENSSKQEVIHLKNQLRTKEEELSLTHRHHQEELQRLAMQVKGNNSNVGDFDSLTSSANNSPSKMEDSHTTKLLKHLQGRVKQLRSDNESLRNISEGEGCLTSETQVNDSEDDISPAIQRKIGKLQAAVKIAEEKAHKNASLLSQKMMEMTKLQKMLTHSTKENMKLEREYAELQRKIIDSSR